MNQKSNNIKNSSIFYISNHNTEIDMIFIEELKINKKESKAEQEITYDINNVDTFKQGDLIFDFLTADFKTEALADKTFFNKFIKLKDKIKSFTTDIEMIEFQKKFRACVDFTFYYEVGGNPYDIRYKEYMRHADYNKTLQYLKDDVEIFLDTPVRFKGEGSFKQNETQISKTTLYTNDVYRIKSVSALLYIALKEYVTYNNMPIRKCKNCDRYFVAQGRKDELYCTRKYKDTNKTCKQIGSALIYLERLGNDAALSLYRNMNKKKHMQVSRKPDDKKLAKKFEDWKKDAKLEYNKYKQGQLTDEEFIRWLNLNDYQI